MTDNLSFNLKRIFEQILEVYRNLENQGYIKTPRTRQELLILTQQQILLSRPRVILTRFDAINTVDSEKMYSEQKSLKDFIDSENEYDNLLIIEKMIEDIDHTIPFIDYSPNCQSDREIIPQKMDEEVEKIVNNNCEEITNSNMIQSTVDVNLVEHEAEMADMEIDAEILEIMESVIREEEENKSVATTLTATERRTSRRVKNVNQYKSDISAPTLRRGQRVRKPALYNYRSLGFSSPESAPKKRKRPTQPPKTGIVHLTNSNVVKFESRPMNSEEHPEVEILFPANLHERNLKISLDLNKFDLPPNVTTTSTKSNNKNSKKKSKPKSKSVSQEKSDVAKYLEYFSTSCETPRQNINYGITSTQSESPHNTITTTTVDNLYDQISTTQIDSRVSTFLTSNEHGEWILTTETVPAQQIVTKSNNQMLQRSQQQQQLREPKSVIAVTSTDNTTQVDEDFVIPMDIENNAFRLVEYIENDNENFTNQHSTIVQQPTQSEFPLIANTTNCEKNPRSTISKFITQNKDVNCWKRDRNLSKSKSSLSCGEPKMLSKFDENRNRAHASSLMFRSFTPICEVLDLSLHKTRSNLTFETDDIIDLSVRPDSYPSISESSENHEIILNYTVNSQNTSQQNESAKSTTEGTNQSQENIIDKSARKITLEEYKKRNRDFSINCRIVDEKSPNQGEINAYKKLQPISSTKKKSENKVLTMCRDMPCLSDDMDLDYEFDSTCKESCDKTTKSTSNLQTESPITKDSGIGSTDFDNKKKGNNSPSHYVDKTLESLLSDHELDEDDALSLYAHSLLGSPLNISETNDDNLRDICTPEFDQQMTFIPPPLSEKSTPCVSVEKSKFDSKKCTLTSKVTTDNFLPLTIPKVSDRNMLKNFKIPKIKPAVIAQLTNNESIIPTPQNKVDPIISAYEEVSFPANILSNKRHKRTRSISPPICSPSSRSSASVSSLPLESDLHTRKIVICNIFGNPCFAYLNESCKKTRCNYNHRHLDANVLRTRLLHLSNTMLQNAYKFIWRNYRLFVFYFPTFCEIYGERGDKTRLSAMAKDCEMYSDSLRFLKCVVHALIKAGLSHVAAIKLVMENVKLTTNEIIDVLIEMMLESEPLQFLDILEMYSTHPLYRFKMDAINKMAQICNQTKHFDLIQILLKIIIFQVSHEDLMNYKSEDITTFLVMVRGYHTAEKIENVCSNLITNTQNSNSVNNTLQHTPITRNNTTQRSALPTMTIPQYLGFNY